jgi:hypothetical protein
MPVSVFMASSIGTASQQPSCNQHSNLPAIGRVEYGVMSRQWKSCTLDNNEMHIVPHEDLIEHEPDECPCGPRTEPMQREDGSFCWVVVHSSLDGRECSG